MKLKQLIAQYVAFRKSMGNDFESEEGLLKTFCRAMGDEIAVADVTADRVKAFLDGAGPISGYWHRKHTILNGFYRYALSRGHVSVSPLPVVTPKQPERFVPYIYSHEELRRLLDGTASYQKQRILLEPYTFRAALLLLYGAGLRLSEALCLTLEDVDLLDAVIIVRDTKFYKTRLVPLGPELNQAMSDYAHRRRRDGHSQDGSAPFFVTRAGARVPIRLIQRAFRRLRAQSGVRRQSDARFQPRLHDLRHSFAVHRLTTWYREGKNVQHLLPYLSTYLGHSDIASTQLYLTMTPELLQEASVRFERYALQGGEL
jgi:site-specific recombinase XerD